MMQHPVCCNTNKSIIVNEIYNNNYCAHPVECFTSKCSEIELNIIDTVHEQ